MDARSNLSRTFFGKPLCVYCEGIADTKDHAPPRCLLRIPIGNDAKILTFPACSACNRSFSPAENLFKAVLATVSFEPDLIAEADAGGSVHRALERDGRLKMLIQAALQPNGYFQISPAILAPMLRVITKTVQGLYFAIYGRILSTEAVSVISVDHAKQMPPEEVARSLRRSSTPDLSTGAWPEVRPNPRRLAKAALLWPGGTEHDLMQPVEWIDIQPGAFRFAFFRGEEGRAICLMDIRSTIVAAASCPWPADRGPVRKGRNQKYSRDAKAKLDPSDKGQRPNR